VLADWNRGVPDSGLSEPLLLKTSIPFPHIRGRCARNPSADSPARCAESARERHRESPVTTWCCCSMARPVVGAALAYFTLFSVAPVLIVITGVAGLFIGHAAAHGQVAPWLQRFLSPEGAKAAELMLKQAATPAGGILTTAAGLLTLFLGTSALIGEPRQSMNVVWRVRQPPFQETGIAASMRALLGDRYMRSSS
jgi:UPF0716 family protein affecting phage T7 exclusion